MGTDTSHSQSLIRHICFQTSTYLGLIHFCLAPFRFYKLIGLTAVPKMMRLISFVALSGMAYSVSAAGAVEQTRTPLAELAGHVGVPVQSNEPVQVRRRLDEEGTTLICGIMTVVCAYSASLNEGAAMWGMLACAVFMAWCAIANGKHEGHLAKTAFGNAGNLGD